MSHPAFTVENIHERELIATGEEVGKLIDSLASPADLLWPGSRWVPMKFDRPLQVGAVGGHGPIRYFVEAYEPGRAVAFRFTAPRGFHGGHSCQLQETGPGRVRLRHVLTMSVTGLARLSWPLVFRWLHDALIEDLLDRAQAHVGMAVAPRPWSPWVRFLRWLLSRRKRPGRRKAGSSREQRV